MTEFQEIPAISPVPVRATSAAEFDAAMVASFASQLAALAVANINFGILNTMMPDFDALRGNLDELALYDLTLILKTFPTMADAVAAEIPEPTKVLLVTGYATPGDGGISRWRRVDDEPSHDGKFQSADGAWWAYSEPVVYVGAFGVIYNDRTKAAANTAALQKAIDFGGEFDIPIDLGSGSIFIDDTLHIKYPVTMYGQGNALWRWLNNGANEVAPTQIVLTGTGPKTWYVEGISSMRASGAVWANPSNYTATVNDAEYSMQSMTDGDGAAIPLSVGILVSGLAASFGVLRDFRIFPDGGGDDGLDLYNNYAEADENTPWAADWDFGIIVGGGTNVTVRNVQSVGHFRRSGLLVCTINSPVYDSFVNPFHLHIESCKLEGWRALALRGADSYRVTETDASTYIKIPYAADNPFRVLRSIMLLTSAFSGPIQTFTTVEVTDTGTMLRLSGFEAGALSGVTVGSYVKPPASGGGSSHIVIRDTELNAIRHPSGRLCNDVLLGDNAFSYPASLLECSGQAFVEIMLYNVKFFTADEVFFHLHEVRTISMDRCWFETTTSTTWSSGHLLARFIAAPIVGSNPNVASGCASGFTNNVTLDTMNFQYLSTMDARPYYPLLSTAPFNNGADNGMFTPGFGSFRTYQSDSHAGWGSILRAPVGGRAALCAGTGYNPTTGTYAAKFWYADGALGDILNHSVDILPSTNNARVMGSASYQYATVHTGIVNSNTLSRLYLAVGGTNLYQAYTTSFSPTTDNDKSLGISSAKYSVVYAGTGTINTSDAREKQDVEDFDDLERLVAQDIKKLIKKYRFKDAVAKKGDGARIHVGVVAQDVEAAFVARGLDPARYALFCYDEWEAQDEITDAEGNIIQAATPAGSRYGIRYDELLSFVIAAM